MSKKRIVDARSPEYSVLGHNLTAVRNALGLTQAEASKRIGIPQSTYSGYETGSRRITLSKLKDIASAYGVTVDYLIGTPDEDFTISDEEKILIEKYRNSDEDTKNVVRRLLAYADAFNSLKEEK